MISEIRLKDVATYKDEKLTSKKINFIYGNNGTGKTTISRFIENPKELKFSKSKIAFDAAGECNKLIYNQDFVKILTLKQDYEAYILLVKSQKKNIN